MEPLTMITPSSWRGSLRLPSTYLLLSLSQVDPGFELVARHTKKVYESVEFLVDL
jgi:hypothetical protein